MRSRAADVMLVLGDIGEMREIAEGADDLDVLIAREAVQYRLELAPRGFILLAMKTDLGPANLLDDCKDRWALLGADGVAENAAEQTDIVAQRQILVGGVKRIHDAPRACGNNSSRARSGGNANTFTREGAVLSRQQPAHPMQAASARLQVWTGIHRARA